MIRVIINLVYVVLFLLKEVGWPFQTVEVVGLFEMYRPLVSGRFVKRFLVIKAIVWWPYYQQRILNSPPTASVTLYSNKAIVKEKPLPLTCNYIGPHGFEP